MRPPASTKPWTRIAAEHSLPPQLIHSVIKVESNYNPYAISSKGALGLMQLIPATARRFGVKNVFNPVENIQGGAKYLRYLLDLFDGNYPAGAGGLQCGRSGGDAIRRDSAVSRKRRITWSWCGGSSNWRRRPRRKRRRALRARPEAKPEGRRTLSEVAMPDGSVRYVLASDNWL